MDADLGVLGDVASEKRTLPPTEVERAYADLETKVKALREEGVFRQRDLAAGEAFFGHVAALRVLRDELTLVHQLVGELPRKHLPAVPLTQAALRPACHRLVHGCGKRSRRASPRASRFCCSGGFIRPARPAFRWVPGFSARLGRMSLTTGGTGDLRSFQRMFMTALTGIPIVAALWLLMPLLSNYWAMNTLLFVLCYGFGFVVVRATGFSYGLQFMTLAISTMVGINPQVPVAFGTLRDAFLGLLIGLFLGGAVSRLIWPVLPQGLLRDDLGRFFRGLRTLLRGSAEQEYILTGTMLLPLSALQAVDAMVLPQCPADERERLTNFIRLAHPLGLQIAALQREKATPMARADCRPAGRPAGRTGNEVRPFSGGAGAVSARAHHGGRVPRIFAAKWQTWMRWSSKCATTGVGASVDYAPIAHLLAVVNRHHTIARRLEDCRKQLAPLRLDRYLRDVAL